MPPMMVEAIEAKIPARGPNVASKAKGELLSSSTPGPAEWRARR
jgi:hypothetical protein